MEHDENINRIENPQVIAKILTKHYNARGKFCLSTVGGDFRADTAIVDNDPHAEYLLVDVAPAKVREAIETAPSVEVRASIDSLFTWFHTEDLSIVVEDGERYYEIPYPEQLFQLQRRNAFRINLPTCLTATITGTIQDEVTGEEQPFRAMLENLSATGGAMSISGRLTALLGEGARILDARIRIPDRLDIVVDAEVRNRRPGREEGDVIIGFAFLCLSAIHAQQITRAVMDIQRQTLLDPNH